MLDVASVETRFVKKSVYLPLSDSHRF
jgi:hypothetical protein